MEMAEGSQAEIVIHVDQLKVQIAALEYARMGLVPRRGIQEPAIHRRPDADRSGGAGRETGYRL